MSTNLAPLRIDPLPIAGGGTLGLMALPLAWILGRTDFRWKTTLFAVLAGGNQGTHKITWADVHHPNMSFWRPNQRGSLSRSAAAFSRSASAT